MAVHGKTSRVLLGPYDVSEHLNEASVSTTLDTSDVTHFGVDDKKYIAGQGDGTASFGGFHEAEERGVRAALDEVEASTSGLPFVLVIGGNVVGRPAYVGQVLKTGFDVSSPVGDVVSVSGALQGNGGIDLGVLLGDSKAVSVDTQWDSVDNGMTSGNGGIAYLICSGNGTDDAVTITVEDSSDDVTFATIAETTVAADATAAVAVPIDGTINRYVRLTITVVGTGTVAATAALVRN